MSTIITLGGSSNWTTDIKKEFESKTSQKIKFIHPTTILIYSCDDINYATWVIDKLYNCNIVLINMKDYYDSADLAVMAINTINQISDKHIYVVGVGCDKKDSEYTNSLVKNSICYSCEKIEDAVDYIVTNLI